MFVNQLNGFKYVKEVIIYKKNKMHEDFQIKPLKVLDKYYTVNPMKNQCLQINVVKFLISL